MNYGAIGFDIGHEIIHGLDATMTNITNYDVMFTKWCEPLTSEKFHKRAHCLINQYNNYTVDDIGLKVIIKNLSLQ